MSIRQTAVSSPQAPLDDDQFLKIPAVAVYLSMSRASIYNLMERGDLPYARFGRSRRISKRHLREYCERCMVAR